MPRHANAEKYKLSDEQKEAIYMMNYLSVLTYRIKTSQNNRLFLEDVHSKLYNNINLNSMDEATEIQLSRLLNTIEKFRLIDIKREQLNYIHERNQAKAIRAAVPNPMSLIGLVASNNPVDFANAIVYMAVDAYTSYNQYTSDAELQKLKDGWMLEKEASEVVQDSCTAALNYWGKLVRKLDLPNSLILRDDEVKRLADWEDTDLDGRIRFLKQEEDTYQAYGGYWLLLAESNYRKAKKNPESFRDVLTCIDTYEEMNVSIFGKDYDFARVLPLAITSALQVLPEKDYVKKASHYCEIIHDNTNYEDWALRYFTAQTYVDLFTRTNDRGYLKLAYEDLLDNVNGLIKEQQKQNTEYLKEIKNEKGDSKEVKAVKDTLRKTRKMELPPVNEALLINCDLLYLVVEKLSLSSDELKEIDGILHPDDRPAFMVDSIEKKYWFSKSEVITDKMDASFSGDTFVIPASCVSQDATILVTVRDSEDNTIKTIDDWRIQRVNRNDKDDMYSFHAVYASEEADNYEWLPNCIIEIQVNPKPDYDFDNNTFYFETKNAKEDWTDYLQVWKGHKTHWYDYGMVWKNSIEFCEVEG